MNWARLYRLSLCSGVNGRVRQGMSVNSNERRAGLKGNATVEPLKAGSLRLVTRYAFLMRWTRDANVLQYEGFCDANTIALNPASTSDDISDDLVRKTLHQVIQVRHRQNSARNSFLRTHGYRQHCNPTLPKQKRCRSRVV